MYTVAIIRIIILTIILHIVKHRDVSWVNTCLLHDIDWLRAGKCENWVDFEAHSLISTLPACVSFIS